MSDTYTFETVYNVYSDRDGRKISVGPDADGLDLVELIDHESKARITVEPTHARLLAAALIKAADDAEECSRGASKNKPA